MSLFQGASEFVIYGGQFTANYHQGAHDEYIQLTRRLVEKDSSLNQYSVAHGTVIVPCFSKALLLRDLRIDPDAGRISAGSCSFDLLARLGLLPKQINEALAEYDTAVPLDEVVNRGNCYCGRISRHGFIFLVSKYFQHASMGETTKDGTCFILTTSIGRFKCYEIHDRIFVHFDSGTRSSHIDLIKDQNLDDILRTSRGEYQVADVASHVHLTPSNINVDNAFVWRRSTGAPIEEVASRDFLGVPNAVIYMTKATLQRWKRLQDFGFEVISAVFSVLHDVKEPAEFVTALASIPHEFGSEGLLDRVEGWTPAQKLASCVFVCRLLSGKTLCDMSYQSIYNYTVLHGQNTLEAHKYFRSPRVEFGKFYKTSRDRLLKILDGFQIVDDVNGAGRLINDHIQHELQALLHSNKNNIALVANQAVFALLLEWNASRVLLRAREAPDEWIRFVGAEDDMLFLG